MSDPVIDCLRDEFDRFIGLMELQIDRCPEPVWNRPGHDFPFSQHILHTLACSMMFTATEGEPYAGLPYSRQEIMFAAPLSRDISKEEMRDLAQKVRRSAHEFMAGLDQAKLAEKHQVSSTAMGRDRSNAQALIALVRHICYHLGCCDAALKNNGAEAVH